MKKFFAFLFNFFKTYPAIFYSFFLIIFLPLFLYGHTFYLVKKFEENINFILHRKGVFLQNVISEFIIEFFAHPEILQEKIEKMSQTNPEIKQIRILKKEEDNFRIICSQKKEEIGAILDDPGLLISWSRDETIASLISSQDRKERWWRIIFPISNKGEKLAIVSFALSLRETDAMMEKLIFRTFLVTILGIIISLFLVFQHTNLFGYVEMTRKLREIDKAKDDFIRMATHELQSPVVNIRAYLAEIKEKIRDKLSPQEMEDFERIEISAANLGNLISDILTVSRLEGGRLDFTPSLIDLNKEVKEIVNEFLPKAREKNLLLYFSPLQQTVYVKANQLRLREILGNLISNAIKYTFQGEIRVEMKVDHSKKRCYIFVIDTGVGISAQAQKNLFQKFFRERKKETANVSGTGLGLWLVKQMVEKMGGEIFVESIEGRGSKFFFYLPLA